MIKDFFADKPWQHRLMLLAIALLFWAQFLLYKEDPNRYSVGLDRSEVQYGEGIWTGWEVNWLIAGPCLVVLAIMFLFPEAYRTRFVQRFGYGLAVVLVPASTMNAGPSTSGGDTAILALILAAVAAVRQLLAQILGRKTAANISSAAVNQARRLSARARTATGRRRRPSCRCAR